MNSAIAMIPYANMAPYRQLGPPEGCRFVSLVPKASITALMTGEVAAAAVPVGGLPQLAGIVEPLGRFGIAAKGPSMSVLLFSRRLFQQISSPQTLRLTGESASSVRLLYLLLGDTSGFDRLPRLAAHGQTPDAELLIGDRALVKGASIAAGDGSVQVTDLAQVWYERYGLPFVFARWVVRKDAPRQTKSALTRWLDRFKAEEAMLVDRAIPQSASRLNLPREVMQRYFNAIRRCLDESDISGQKKFFRLIAQYGREPLFQSIHGDHATEEG